MTTIFGRADLGITIAAIVLSSVFSPHAAQAQLPATRLSAAFPAGGQPGTTVDVTIAGADLDDVASLQFSHPSVTAKQKQADPGPFDNGPQPVPNTFVVTIAGDAPLGTYEVRAAGKYGLSNPRAFTVGDVPELLEREPNNDVSLAGEVALPAVINGQAANAADVDVFKFAAAAGQRIIITVLARRIDSNMDAVVTVSDSAGRQLGGSRDDLGLDPLIDFTAPAAGEYLLKIHDSAYRGGPEYVYRIAAGVLPHIDFVFPPAGQAGGNRTFTLFGRNLPGGQPAGLNVAGRPLEKLDVAIPIPGAQELAFGSLLEPAAAGLDAAEFRVKGPLGSSVPVLVGVATAPPVLEAEPNNDLAKAQAVTVPCEVMGRFEDDTDRDWYSFPAKQGESITIEVICRRAGVRANPNLVVQRVVPPAAADQKEQAEQLAYVSESGHDEAAPEFDVRNDDPEFRFTAPADGTYRVRVADQLTDVRSDPRRVYRLAIRNGRPDYRLAAAPEHSYAAVLLRKGGQAAIRVVAFRRDGFDGEIRVNATGLPSGVTCGEAVIGPARNSTMLVLQAAADAAPTAGVIQVVGKAQIDGAEAARIARFGAALVPSLIRQDINQIVPPIPSRLTRNLAVSVSAGETVLVAFAAGGGKVWETSRAGIVKIPWTKSGPFAGNINFVPRGLPANISAPAAATGGPNGEFQINLTAATPTGTYSFYLDGLAPQADYRRNPEAVEAATKRKLEVDKIKAESDAAAKVAADAKAAADKLVTDTAAAAKAATDAKAVAEKTLTDAQTAAKTAADQAAQAKAAAAANTGDANLAAAATNAQKAADDSAAKVKTAIAVVEAAQKVLVDADAKAKVATDAKAVSDKQAADAAERARLATELKTQTDKLVTDTTNAAQPRKVNIPIVSTPVTLKITPAPITMAELKPAGPLKQGEKLDVPISIARLYGYNDAVTISPILPPGVAGLSIPNVAIPAGQAQINLAITATPDATVGEHLLTVRATLVLNGQGLTVDQPLRLTVQKVEKK